jgi:hypothetical protein
MVMGWLKGLFGGGGESGEVEGTPVEHEGYTIVPAPQKKGSQWNTAGIIRKEIGGEVKEHRFVRVDTHASRDQAEAFSVQKAQQIIAEQGDMIFRPPPRRE